MHQFYWPSNLLTGGTHLDNAWTLWTAGMLRPIILTDCIDFRDVSMLCSGLLENGQVIILGTCLQKALSYCVKQLEYTCLSFMSSKLDWTDMIHL